MKRVSATKTFMKLAMVTVSKTVGNVGDILSSIHTMLGSKKCLLKIFESIQYLRMQGIAFRGHDNSVFLITHFCVFFEEKRIRTFTDRLMSLLRMCNQNKRTHGHTFIKCRGIAANFRWSIQEVSVVLINLSYYIFSDVNLSCIITLMCSDSV